MASERESTFAQHNVNDVTQCTNDVTPMALTHLVLLWPHPLVRTWLTFQINHSAMVIHPPATEAERGCCKGWHGQWMSAEVRLCGTTHTFFGEPCPPLLSLIEQFQAPGGLARWLMGQGSHAGGLVTLPHPWAHSELGMALACCGVSEHANLPLTSHSPQCSHAIHPLWCL